MNVTNERDFIDIDIEVVSDGIYHITGEVLLIIIFPFPKGKVVTGWL